MKTILVVEDQKDLRLNLQEILEREGYSILTATNGLEALELTATIEPDLILSDILMPDMDGFELLKTLQTRKNTSGIPFIFLTAKVEMQDLRNGMVLGADDYLMKPFKIDDLINAIDTRLRKKENHIKLIEEFKNTIVRKIPHELYTPLVGILGFSELIECDTASLTDEEIKSMAAKIKTSGKRLQRRIDKFVMYTDLMNYTSPKQRQYGIKPTYVFDPIYAALKLKNIASSFNREEDIYINLEPTELYITEEHFDNMLKELIENSAKFSEERTPIKILGYENEDIYNVEIIDYGVGLKEINGNNINLFNQEAKDFQIAEGLGIGLVIVNKIIEMYRGSLKIDSIPENYTKIIISLPAKKKLKE